MSPPYVKVARDVACGLQYLHEEKKLLHGDLKSGNILIQGDFKAAKLCDFGVSLKLDEKGALREPDAQCYIGTECWSAPEALVGGVVTHKADMFSFGLILWNIIVISCDFLGSRPSLPDTPLTEDYLPVLEIFYACTEAEPAKRPSAGQIVHILDSMTDDKENTKGVGGNSKFLEMLHEDL
ncbi:Lymphokine-activated killer T-cell-originated protein kinase [Chionoecetes opilio]|uniref:Lymphokine-activated killer T-cell-originated protein kinase n=1 Tax=Chionoecetes opilio TaxID=41210 RepID=A0A8J4YAK5_CHIOP|nr:Lymphokine-activated killer T-cell-originated protein kinase [Chionoecetes opilio]